MSGPAPLSVTVQVWNVVSPPPPGFFVTLSVSVLPLSIVVPKVNVSVGLPGRPVMVFASPEELFVT